MKSNFFRYLLVAGFLLMGTISAFSQEFEPFKVRYQANLKGDLTFIANNIVNRQADGYWDRVWVPKKKGNGGKWEDVWVSSPVSPNDPYNLTGDSSDYNDYLNMRYIDVDTDNSTFSSSSATLNYPSPECNRIQYAGLYWSATYPSELAGQSVGTNRQTDFNRVKLKVPGGNYLDITGEVLYNGFTSTETDMRANSPYACYADVTALLTALPDPQGEYTVANVRSTQGVLAGGISAGWTLVIVYENTTSSGKLITTYDGFARVRDQNSVNILYDGFNTVPTGPVRAHIGVAALEGDNKIIGDNLQIAGGEKSFSTISNATNPANNFFNSNITLNGVVTTNRNPGSVNTLGYDTDIFELINTNNSIIANNETKATFKFGTNGDQYYPFFNSFNIEIIQPDIVLEKRVHDLGGNDITGQGVHLGDELVYVLKFRNVGNDDAKEYSIRDVLPINTTFISADLSGAPGTTRTAVDANNQIVFNVPNNLVNVGDPAYTIRMRVKVAENCFDFVDACSNMIENLAYSSYKGVSTNFEEPDDPSVMDSDSCGFTTPGATNFLLDNLEDCNIARPVQLCGENVTLNAGENFVEYIWYKDVNNNGQIDSGDTRITNSTTHQLTVTDIGTYIVDKKANDPCKGFKEIFTVTRFGETQTNPIVDWFNARNNDTDLTNNIQGEIATCPIDGSLLPKIDLCGVNDSQLIQINIADAQSMVWERLVEGSCTDAGDDCGNKNATCDWDQVSTGNTFTANSAGKFRLVINYQNGCFSRFYFNVFQNNLDVNVNSEDIYCTTPGNITVTNLGNGYGYQLYDVTNGSISVPYSANNGPSFNITTNGTYRVGIMQLDNNTGEPIAGSCEFSTEDIAILNRQMEVNVTSKEASCGNLGSITIQASHVRANYEYEIRYDDGSNGGDGSLLNRVTAQTDNNYTFPDLNPGDYIVSVKTDDGCAYSQKMTVGKEPELELSALVTADIGCSDGEITLTATGGNVGPGYSYAIWSYNGSSSPYDVVQDIPDDQFKKDGNTFSFAAGEEGTYVFVVMDGNHCSAFSNPVTIRNNGILAATVSAVDVSCSGNGNGEITILATGGVGPYAYSIEGGDAVEFVDTANIVGLAPGTYDLVVMDSSGCELPFSRTIEQPFPLSASAGVSRDASCDPDNGAEVRVTNVVGGTPIYTYSFDGGASYGTNSIQQLHPGTYTVIVKDARGCTFEMPVTVADIPLPPNVTLTPVVSYDCVGEGTITVATDNPDFVYTYMIDGVLNTPDSTSNVFTKVAPGNYTIRTIYKSQIPPTPSLLLSEDFGSGGTIPSPNTVGYTYEDQTINPPGDNNVQINDYEYSVTSSIVSPFGDWTNPKDHTSGGLDNQGRYLVINIGTPKPGQIIYSKQINDVIPHQPLRVSLWAMNLLYSGVKLDPNLTIEIREIGTGNVVASTKTGLIPKSNPSIWNNRSVDLDPGAHTSLEFVIRTEVVGDNGNDIAIDDIEVYQIPEVCERFVDTPVIVEPNKKFEGEITGMVHASCFGESTGSITFEVANFNASEGYQYSIDGGANWSAAVTNAVTTIPNLAAGEYTIMVRKANETDCGFELKPEPLTEPTEVKVEAHITAEFMCSNGGATITASASGGTPGYEYQLEDSNENFITGYDFATNGSNRVFEGLAAGEYVVRARDTRNCDDAVSEVQIIEEPETLAFTATPTACYSGNNTGEITVTVTAGNGGYSFFINKGTGLEGPYQPDTATPDSYTFTNLGSGDYTIEVRDGYSCSVPSLPLAIAPELEVTASAPAITACASNTDISITAIGGDGNYVYAVVPVGTTPANTDFSATNPVAVSAAGNYEVHVRDHGGATGFCSDMFPITIDKNDPISITPTVTHVSCFDGNNGSISLSATGGNAPYTYSIDNGATFETSGDFPNLIAGTYNVVVKDADECSETVEVVVNQPDAITAEAVQTTDYTCLPNGEAVITVGSVTPTAGGSGDYEYSLNGGSWTTSTVFNGLTNGTHTIRVRDANAVDCFISLPAIIIDPLPVAPTLSSAVEYNCDGTGNITITPFDNAYTYMLGGLVQTGATPNVFTNLAPGNHIITVNYGSECTVDIPVRVDAGKEFTATITNPVDISCFEGNNGSFVINASNFGTGGFKYSVNGVEATGTFTSSQTVTGLTEGDYEVVVWDVRDVNCAVPLTQTLTEPAKLTATASVTSPFTCDNTGATITVEASGGTPGYTYSLNGGTYQSSAIFRDVPAGTHTITVRDANQCIVTVTDPVIIATPQAPTFTVEPTACYTGNNDGTIIVKIDPLPGNGNFRFRLNGGIWTIPDPVDATTHTFTGLANGSYTIDVMDGFGCKAVQVPVELNPQLVASVDVQAISSCADGLITVNATGGNGTLVYAIVPAGSDPEGLFTTANTLTITNAMATANPAGYDVYVRDNNGVDALCFFDQKGIILTPAIPLELTATSTDPECFNGLGSIEAVITGGRAPFTYTLVDLSPADGIDYGVSYSNVYDLSYAFTGIGVGNYEITITDADNCSLPAVSATINNAIEIKADIEPILPSNCDSSVPFDYGFNFKNLVTPTGIIEYSFDGGDTWNKDGSEQRGIPSGTTVYPSIRVTLDSGTICEKDFPRYIIPYPLDDLDITISAIVVDCADLQVTVQGTAGIPPYKYAYSDDPANFDPTNTTWVMGGATHIINDIPTTVTPGHGNHIWTGLIPGKTYVFYVQDATGCVRQSLQNVNDLVNLPMEITADIDPSCFTSTPGLGNGEIAFTLNPDTPSTHLRWEFFEVGNPIPVQVSGGGATASNIVYTNIITIPGLAEGEYYIQVIQTDGTMDTCVGASENVLVEELKELKATATATRDISCNLPGLISVTGITGGGGAPYTFDVTGPAGFTPLTGLTSNPVQIPVNSPAGDYTVTLYDQYGCPVPLDPVPLDLSPNPIITGVTQDNCNAPISLNVTATSDAGNLRYAIVVSGDPIPTSTAYLDNSGIFNNVASGTYDVYVMDGNGCIDSRLAFIVDPVLSAKVEASLMDCTASPDAVITLEVLAGSGNYAYSVSGPQTLAKTALTGNTVDYNASIPGDYIITVYDKKSQAGTECTRELPIKILPPVKPVFTETHVDVSCNGANNGSITLIETNNGVNPLDYQLHYATAGNPLVDAADFTYNAATKTYSDLAPGEYVVRGIGPNECFTDLSVTIDDIEAIAITAVDVTEFACTVDTNTSNNASITVTTVTGGSGNYTYEFVNNQGTADTADDEVVKARSEKATYTETKRQGGSYTINVYDGNNCVGSTDAQIQPYLEMTDIVLDPTDPSCIPGADGTIKVDLNLSAALGTTNIQYDIEGLDVVYQDTYTGNVATHSFTGLGIGTYQITATNLVTKCVIIGIAELKDPNTFEVHIDSTTDVICYNTATGTATFSVTDPTYTGDYTWEAYWDNGTPLDDTDDVLVDNNNSSARLTTIGLAAGNYYVSFAQVGLPTCENKKPFRIAGPDAGITASTKVTPITCDPTDNGIIEIFGVAGGWGDYTYYVGLTSPTAPSDFVTDPKFGGLVAGTYQAWVRDAKGCETLVGNNIILTDPVDITANLRINDHNCTNFEGEIEVVGIPETDPIRGGQGSNYSYQLQILDGGIFVNLRNKQTTPIFSGLGAGEYQVIVSDQWGCVSTPTAAINLYDVMELKAEVVKLIDCMPGNEAGQITITQTGGVGPFTYTGTFPDGSDLTPNTDGIFTGLDQIGKYTFTVTDAVGCSVEIKETLKDAIQPPTPVINDFEDVSCYGLANGTITVSVPNNGLEHYTFKITHKDGVALATPIDPFSATNTSAVFKNLDVTLGVGYTITVTAANRCTATVTQTITQPDELEIVTAPTVDPFECIVGNATKYPIIDLDGLVTGGSGNYIRYVFVNDANPGVAVYDGPDSDYTVRDLAGGNYTITVYDDNGCSVQTTATLAPFVGISDPKVNLANTGVTCDGDDEDIQVSVTTTLGAPTAVFNLEYSITSPNTGYTAPNNSTGLFTGLGVGNYIITVTNLTTGCFVTTTHEVKEPKVIQAVATKVSDELCLNDGTPDGSFSVAINNYIGGYDYQVFRTDGSIVTGAGFSGSTDTTADNPLTISGLPGGVYYVVITGTDHPFCADESNRVTIDAPEAPISAEVSAESNVSCDDGQGSILVKAAGGKGPYIITLDDGTGQPIEYKGYAHLFTGLSAGVFNITVEDALGCVYTHNRTIELELPKRITANIDSTELVCFGDTNGEVFAFDVDGGFGVKKYQLNVWDPTGAVIIQTSAPQWGNPNSHRFTNLPAGIYSITITDDANCGTETAKMEIVDPSDVRGDLKVDSTLSCDNDAILVLVASGGEGPYEYSEDGGITYFPMIEGNNDTMTFTVGPGTYNYHVRDAFGCGNVLSNDIQISAIVPLSLTLDTSAAVINCNGESTATIIAKADGGLGNYRYELFTDAAFTQSVFGQPQASGTFSNLAAGDYYVRVTSEDCIFEELTAIKIIEPTPLVVTQSFEDESCSGARDGSITVELSGGSGDYQYAISPRLNRFDTVNTFTNLAPGPYTVIAQDKNGCFEQLEFTIAPATLLLATATSTPEICVGEGDGTIDLTITGGTGPYRTSINSMEDADFILGRTSFSGLTAGMHAVFVRDANDCETYVTVEIEQGVNLNATVTPVYECTGDTPNNSIVLVLEDGTVAADVMYALDSTDPNDMVLEPNFTNLAPGNHFITIAHANGCERRIDFTIAYFEPLVLTLEQRSLNQITAITTGGQAKYTYYFGDVNTGEKNTYYINKTGTYTVTVVDENGCESVASIYMEFVDIDIPNFFTPNGDGGNDTWKPKNQEGFPKILTIIFDRYGREVYRMGLNDEGWDGIYKGNELPTGDYWYVIKLKGENDDREFVGHFTLYR